MHGTSAPNNPIGDEVRRRQNLLQKCGGCVVSSLSSAQHNFWWNCRAIHVAMCNNYLALESAPLALQNGGGGGSARTQYRVHTSRTGKNEKVSQGRRRMCLLGQGICDWWTGKLVNMIILSVIFIAELHKGKSLASGFSISLCASRIWCQSETVFQSRTQD